MNQDNYYPIVAKTGLTAYVDIADADKVSKYKWSDNRHGYLIRIKDKETIFLHHEIIGKHKGMCVDHIDGNKLNNTRSNLRVVTKSQNTHNSAYTRGKSKHRGVSWFTPHNRWRAKIRINGKDIYLGEHKSELKAKLAVDKARQGVFA